MRRGQAIWYRRLTEEHDNLRAALDWCRDDPAAAEREVRLGAALGRFLRIRGHVEEGRQRLARALARSDGTPTPARGRILNWLGQLEWMCGDLARARAFGEESIAVARRVDPPQLPLALRQHSYTLRSLGDESAGAVLEEALAAARAIGDQREEAFALSMLGTQALANAGDTDAAARLLDEAIALGRRVGDATMLGVALATRGRLNLLDGDLDAAGRLFAECLACAESVDYRNQAGFAWAGLGEVDAARGAFDAAQAKQRRAIALQRATGAGAALSGALIALASTWAVAGQAEAAARLLGAASEWRRRHGIVRPFFLDSLTFDRALAAARERSDPAPFDVARRAGSEMSLEEAADWALAEPAGGRDRA